MSIWEVTTSNLNAENAFCDMYHFAIYDEPIRINQFLIHPRQLTAAKTNHLRERIKIKGVSLAAVFLFYTADAFQLKTIFSRCSETTNTLKTMNYNRWKNSQYPYYGATKYRFQLTA